MKYRRTHPICKLPDWLKPKLPHTDKCVYCGGVVIAYKNGWVESGEIDENGEVAPREKWLAYHFVADCNILEKLNESSQDI